MVEYQTNVSITVDQMIDLYTDSTLGQRRPVDDRDRMRAMLENANLLITAWSADQLVGVARSLTDFAYATYLSDLAVRLSFQRKGIGRELIRHTQAAAPLARIVLLSAPKAVSYYPHIGMTPHNSAWMLGSGEQIK